MNWFKRFAGAYRATKFTGGNPASPSYWIKKLFGGANATLSGVEIDTETALKFSAVWAAVNIISGAIGFLPLITYKRLKPRGKERANDLDVYYLLHDRPNEYMDAMTFREVLQGHVLTWGNGYAEIERDNAYRPLALWPLPPNKVTPKIDNKRELVYEVSTDKGVKVLAHYDVLHIKGLGFDGLKGYPVIEFAAENLGLGLAAEKNASAFFGNDSSPTGVLHTDDVLGKETKEKVEKDWEQKHKGLDKKYRIAVLHSGLKWEQIGIPAKDAQLIESRKFSVNDVARWFSIPPHMIADLEKSSFNNIEHQGIEFVVWTLQRWIKKWENESNYKLFKKELRKVYFAEFLVTGLLRGDTRSRYQAYNIGRNAGFLSPNDIRELENMNPVEGGDTYLEPLNMQPLGSTKRSGDFRVMFENIWQRIITKETNAMRKALKNPENFTVWADEFYEKHTDYVARLLESALEAHSGMGSLASTIARDYVSRRISEVKKAFEENRIDDVINELSNQPKLLTNCVMGV